MRCLRSGLRPDEFWDCTLAEALLFLRGQEDREREQWDRQAHLMSLIYNINRGKGRPLTWEDFTPFSVEMQHAEATVVTEDFKQDLMLMKQMVNNGK